MATVTRMPQRGWQQPCACGCSHPPGTPCPPAECRPCPDPNWMLWGQQLLAWNQQIQQLKQLVKEIVEEIGGPVHTGPIQGVTDGSDAAPGQVGEFITASTPISYQAYPNSTTGVVPAMVVPPGDWNLWAYLDFPAPVGGGYIQLSPTPPGVSNPMRGQDFTAAAGAAFSVFTIIGMPARGSFSVPTLLPFAYDINNATDEDIVAGTATLTVEGRRMR